MKNFNKLFGGLLLAFGLLAGLSIQAKATGLAIMPKETALVSQFTTNCSTITPTISTNSPTTAQFMPGAVYEVNMSTGASAEFVVLFDSGNCTGITANTQNTGLNTGSSIIGTRFMFGSTTASTQWRLDPPLIFHNGLCACDSASTGQASLTFELGRGLAGN